MTEEQRFEQIEITYIADGNPSISTKEKKIVDYKADKVCFN